VVEAVDRLTPRGARVDTRWYVFAVIALALVIDISRARVSWRTTRESR
jgi:hypothetical protein